MMSLEDLIFTTSYVLQLAHKIPENVKIDSENPL